MWIQATFRVPSFPAVLPSRQAALLSSSPDSGAAAPVILHGPTPATKPCPDHLERFHYAA